MNTVADIRQLPELGKESIHIWGVHVPDILDRLDALGSVLSEREQEKAARFFNEADRQSSMAARGALRILLRGYTGLPAAELKFEYSENGKPFLVVPQASRLSGASAKSRRDACGTMAFSVSHSGDWVVLAFGRDRQIGVDIEKMNPARDISAIARRYFTESEIGLMNAATDSSVAFYQLWTRKEAYVKACGSALFRELSTFSVPLEEQGEKAGWFFQRLEAGSKYAAAVVTDKPVASLPCYDFGGMKWDS